MKWRKTGSSLHPTVHVLSLQQNCSSSASHLTLAWLLGTSGVHWGEDFRLTQGESVLGSGWDSDIVLTSPEVSRTHAKITSTGHICMIEDLGSGSGTFVNGERCDDPRALRHRDLIKMGMGEFIYLALDPTDEDVAQTASPVSRSSLPNAAAPAPRKNTLGWLVCQTGELQGLDFRLLEGGNRIGSLSGLELTIPDPNLNSIHMTLECSQDRFYLRSVSSDVRILRNKMLVDVGILKDGDLIQTGSLVLKFRCAL